MFLKMNLNEDVSIERITNLLKQLPLYVMNQRRVRKFPRRHYYVTSFGQVVQADLGEIHEFNGFKYFLVVVDLFSHHIYAEALKNKTSLSVKKAFQKIIPLFETGIEKLETDQVKILLINLSFTR